jgi:hypothetical protein
LRLPGEIPVRKIRMTGFLILVIITEVAAIIGIIENPD